MDRKLKYGSSAQAGNIKLIKLEGEVIEDETLIDLITQAGDIDNFETLALDISSPGGSVSEGIAIMIWLDSLSKLGKKVITIVTANAYSVASLIMLAADYKIISEHGEVMVHNPMISELQYANADELEKYANELRSLEFFMHDLYSTLTGLKLETIKVLMDNETYLTANGALENGFADEVVTMNKRSYSMIANNKKQTNMLKTLNILNKVKMMVTKAEFVNQLYYNVDGGEIEIAQKDPSTYAVGDRTNVEMGSVKLLDGSSLEIKDFNIEKIDKSVEAAFNEGPAPKDDTVALATEDTVVGDVVEAVEAAAAEEVVVVDEAVEETVEAATEATEEVVEEVVEETVEAAAETTEEVTEEEIAVVAVETTDPVVEEVVEEVAEVVAAQISEMTTWEMEVVEDVFEVGTTVHYNPYEGDEPKAISSGEYKLKDGRKILVDSEGVIQLIKPALEVEVEIKVPMDEENIKILTDLLEKQNQTISTLNLRVEELATSNEEAKLKFENLQKFETAATETIEAMAANTVSTFKPEPKEQVEVDLHVGKSIFQRAKASQLAKK